MRKFVANDPINTIRYPRKLIPTNIDETKEAVLVVIEFEEYLDICCHPFRYLQTKDAVHEALCGRLRSPFFCVVI